MANISQHMGADVWGIQGAVIQEEYMGQFHHELPRIRSDGSRGAGKDEAGTYCVVPVTTVDWSPQQPVMMLMMCEANYDLGNLETKLDLALPVIADARNKHRLQAPPNAPVFRFEKTTPCCLTQATEAISVPLLTVFAFFTFPGLEVLRVLYVTVWWSGHKRSLLTRRDILKRVKAKS